MTTPSTPCDLCGTTMTAAEWKIYDRISDPDRICYCELAKELRHLKKENAELRKYIADQFKGSTYIHLEDAP